MDRFAFLFIAAVWLSCSACSTSPSTAPSQSRLSEEDPVRVVADALVAEDLGFILSRLAFVELPCGIPLSLPDGEVPGPACGLAQEPGEPTLVFPIIGCDVRLVPAPQAPIAVAAALQKFELYGGVTLATPNARQRHFGLQSGVFGVVGKTGDRASGLMLSLSANGDIVNLWPGCGEFAAGLMDERFADTVLFRTR